MPHGTSPLFISESSEDKMALAVKNIQAILILFRSFIPTFAINREDIFRSL